MLEIGTSGSMSGEGKRGDAVWPSYRASPRLYRKTASRFSGRILSAVQPSLLNAALSFQ
jgi:hypothetical protein